jgi:hypothetical protein
MGMIIIFAEVEGIANVEPYTPMKLETARDRRRKTADKLENILYAAGLAQ